MVNIIVKNRDTRKYDYEELRRQANSSDPTLARQARETASRISKETSKIEDMREALIKAHREGNHNEIKDIHEFVQAHPEYKNK